MKMTKQQAYNILNDTLAKIQTCRDGHIALSEALNTLMRLAVDENAKMPTPITKTTEKQETKTQ